MKPKEHNWFAGYAPALNVMWTSVTYGHDRLEHMVGHCTVHGGLFIWYSRYAYNIVDRRISNFHTISEMEYLIHPSPAINPRLNSNNSRRFAMKCLASFHIKSPYVRIQLI